MPNHFYTRTFLPSGIRVDKFKDNEMLAYKFAGDILLATDALMVEICTSEPFEGDEVLTVLRARNEIKFFVN